MSRNIFEMFLFRHKEWHKWLALVQWWYNSSHHSSINMTPFEALYGYKPNLLSAVNGPITVVAVDDYLHHRQHTLQALKTELAKAHNRMKQLADWR